ncbi:glycosyltransferase [Parasphingorhabdus sp. JC815]|uniref:glycosyltransferase n=1 Tax=Parasphingorhabdus sp. JC815 TaxID=3232140 RepID=UPI00345B2111
MNNTDASSKISWLVIGPSPPPLGGVTVFISRFVGRQRARGVNVRQAYPNSPLAALRFLSVATQRPEIVIINSMRLPLLLAVFLFFPCSRKIIVDHNHSRKLAEASSKTGVKANLRWRFTKRLLNQFDRIWLVAPHLRNNYAQAGLSTKLTIINPFIAPDPSEYKSAVSQYSPGLRSLLRRDSEELIFAISAYRLVDENGRDLYGFDLALHAMRALLDKGLKAKLVLFIADPVQTTVYQNAKSLITTLNLSDHVLWEEGQKPLWPLFKTIDAYLRPTQTDGWSVSIGEALALNCSVIASDVVPRAKGCVLFNLNDVTALQNAMSLTIKR